MRVVISFLTLFLAFIFFVPTISEADVYMKQKKYVGAMNFMGQNRPAEELIEEIWIADDGFRTDDSKNSVIMLFNEKKMIMLDHEKKSFMEMPMDFSKISKELMKDQDAEQQQALQGMMQNMQKIEATVEVTGEKQKINSWNCQKYIFSMKTFMGVITREVWATEDIKVDKSLYSKFSTSMLSAMPGMQNAIQDLMKEMEKIKGVHVKSSMDQEIMGQTVKSSTELTEFKDSKAPANLFNLPKDYKKQSMR